VDEYGMLGNKPVEFPMDENHKSALAKSKDLNELN